MASTVSHSRSRSTLGALYAFLAAAGFSAKAIFVKLAYVYGVNAVTLLALRMIFSAPFFVAMALWWARSSHLTKLTGRDRVAVVILGLLGYYLASLLDFQGLSYISASLERLILFLYPTLVVLLSALFFRRRITGTNAVSLALCYAGIALVLAYDIAPETGNRVAGAELVFGSVVAYALYLIGSGELLARVGTARFAGYAMTVSCAAAIVHFTVTNPSASLVQPLPVYGYALAMALLSTVMPVVLLAEGIRRIGAGPAAIIGSVGPVVTLALACIFLGETLAARQMLGAAFVIAGALIVGLKRPSETIPAVKRGNLACLMIKAPGESSGDRIIS